MVHGGVSVWCVGEGKGGGRVSTAAKHPQMYMSWCWCWLQVDGCYCEQEAIEIGIDHA